MSRSICFVCEPPKRLLTVYRIPPILLALMVLALPVLASPPSAYLLGTISDSRADGIRGSVKGILVGAVFEIGPVDLIPELGWASTPKIDSGGKGSTVSVGLAARLPRGPWYGEVRLGLGYLRTPDYEKLAESVRFEVGRGVVRWLWLSAHWRIPDRLNSAEDIGITIHIKTGRFYQRVIVEEIRHSRGSGVRIGIMLGVAFGHGVR